jgi:hypothetical protein
MRYGKRIKIRAEDQPPQKIKRRGRQLKPVRYRQPEPPPRRLKPSSTSVKAPVEERPWDGPNAHLRVKLRASTANEQLSEPIIAVIVPVLSRPRRVRELVSSFRSATSSKDAALYFVAQKSDTEEVAAIRAAGYEPIFVGDEDRSWAKKINRGFERTRESWLLLGADDLRFHAGWVDVVRKLLRVHTGVIGTNDLGNRATMRGINSTHPLVRRKYAEVCGTIDERNKVVHDGYEHNCPDTELAVTAKQRGLYIHSVGCVVEHLHPAWGKANADDTYRLGQSSFSRDKALLRERCKRYGWSCV